MAKRMLSLRPIFFLVYFAFSAAAHPSLAEVKIDFSESGSHEKFVDSVEKSQESRFHEIVSRYDQHIAAHPDDAIAATERCRFITYFTYAEDFYIEPAADLLEKSEAYLDRFQNNPDVELYRLSGVYGDEAITQAEALLKNKEIDWSDEQQARIHLTLARQYSYNKKTEETRKHAKLAFDLHPTSESQFIWGKVLKDDKKKSAAIQVLKQSFPDEEAYQKRSRMNLLSELGDEDSAIALLDELNADETQIVNQLEVARIYARSDQIEKARSAFSKAMLNGWNKEVIAHEAFAFEKKHGDAESTLAAYNQLRDQGFRTDPFLRYRLGLVDEYPKLAWKARDFLGLLALVGCGIALLFAPLLLLLPIHYWGLLREKKGKVGLQWEPAWGLRQAWLVLAMYLVVMTSMTYVFGYEILLWNYGNASSEEFPDVSGISYARIFLFGDTLVFVGLILCLGLGFFRAIPTTDWTMAKAIGMALLCVIPVKFIAGINEALVNAFESIPADTSILTQMLNAALEHYGPFGLILGVAILTPIIEEIIFRGVMLTAITKYLPFAWANVLQAFAFMAVHEHFEFFPFLFCFGLICGYLRKASGGLLPSILLHTFHNGLIALGLIFFSR